MSDKYLINSRYSDDDFLGRGGFSKVMKCYDHQLNKYVALNMIKEGSDDVQEVEIMKKIAQCNDERKKFIIFEHNNVRNQH